MLKIQSFFGIERLEDLLVKLGQSFDLIVLIVGQPCSFWAFCCKILEKADDPNALLRVFGENGLEHALDSIIFDSIEGNPLDEIIAKRHKMLILLFEPLHHNLLNRPMRPYIPVVKLLKHEPQQIKNRFIKVFLIAGQYLIVIYELEVNIEKEFVLVDTGEDIPVEKHSEDFEVVFEVVVSVLAWWLIVG